MNATGQIETHRESGARDALSSAVALLEANKAVGIFPEGTRSKRTEAPFLLEGKPASRGSRPPCRTPP